jgi:hypothetical protein
MVGRAARPIGLVPADWKPRIRYGAKYPSKYRNRANWGGKQGKTEIVNAPVVPREPNGRLLPGGPGLSLHGPTPHNDITELRRKYRNNLPKMFDILWHIAQHSASERMQIVAVSELLHRLIGKPQVTIDAVTTKVDVAQIVLAGDAQGERRNCSQQFPYCSQRACGDDRRRRKAYCRSDFRNRYDQLGNPSVGKIGNFVLWISAPPRTAARRRHRLK